MGLGGTTACVCQLIFNKYDINEKNIIQYFIMHGLGLCIKLNCFVAHMFYAWSFSHDTAVPISINQNKYFVFLIYTILCLIG